MKILVTGAAGFVGQHLVRSLKDGGHKVVALVRENTDTTFLRELDIPFVKADLRRKEALYDAVTEGFDAVVHLATTMKGPWEEYMESTVNGTKRLLQVAIERNVKKFIFLSSIAVYAVEGKPPVHIDETTGLEGRELSSYERSKIMAEEVVQEFHSKRMQCTILRSGVIYGPGGPLYPPRLGFSFGKNVFKLVGDGSNKIPLVYIDHLIGAIECALKSEKGDVFNIVDDQNISQMDYLAAVKAKLNPDLHILKVPYPVWAAAGCCVTQGLKLLKRPSPLRGKYLFLCGRQVNYDNSRARKELKWTTKFTPQEALQFTFEWFKNKRLHPKIVDARRNRRTVITDKPLNVALVGCGVIARTHWDILKDIRNTKIVGFCDSNLQAAKAFSVEHGQARAYQHLDEMLKEEKVHVVHIMTPPQTRKELVERAAKAGCHILLEKPMALNAGDAREMVRICKENNVKLCVGHNHVYDPPMIEARKMIVNGDLGKVLYAESWYGFNLSANPTARYMIPGAENHWSMQLPGKLYQNLISHPLSVLTDVIGEPDDIHAIALSGGIVKSMKTDELRVMLKNSRDNRAGLVTVSLAVNPRYQFLNIYGTNMSIFVDFLNKTLIKHATPRGIPKPVSRALMSLTSAGTQVGSTFGNFGKVVAKKFTYFDGTEILIKEFYKRLFTDQPMPVTAEEGLLSMEIMDKVWKQVEV